VRGGGSLRLTGMGSVAAVGSRVWIAALPSTWVAVSGESLDQDVHRRQVFRGDLSV